MYETFARFFERHSVRLEARIEATDESSPHWIKQKVTFAAGYGNERMTAYLYLPRSAGPPFQTIIFVSGVGIFYRQLSGSEKDIFGWSYAEYLVRGGRAVLIPILKGSYERSDGFTAAVDANCAPLGNGSKAASGVAATPIRLMQRTPFSAARSNGERTSG